MCQFLCSFFAKVTPGFLLFMNVKSESTKQEFPFEKWTEGFRLFEYCYFLNAWWKKEILYCSTLLTVLPLSLTVSLGATESLQLSSYPPCWSSVCRGLVSWCSGVSSLERTAACCRPLHGSGCGVSVVQSRGSSCLRRWADPCCVHSGGQPSLRPPGSRALPLSSQVRREPRVARGNFHRHQHPTKYKKRTSAGGGLWVPISKPWQNRCMNGDSCSLRATRGSSLCWVLTGLGHTWQGGNSPHLPTPAGEGHPVLSDIATQSHNNLNMKHDSTQLQMTIVTVNIRDFTQWKRQTELWLLVYRSV